MRILRRELWPYQVFLDVDPELDTAIYNWCHDIIGMRSEDWYSYSFTGIKHIYTFKEESSLLVFKLKWGYK